MKRFVQILRLLNLPCEGIAELISAELERELTIGELLAVRSHVVYCVACRRFRRQVALLREALSRLGHGDASLPMDDLSLPPDVRERMERALRDA